MIIRKYETHIQRGQYPVEIITMYWFLIFPICRIHLKFKKDQ